ncbi:pantothenate synthase [Toensbergia leucococca]|nr:pantothenate synthase [Toensbergia leucococca]
MGALHQGHLALIRQAARENAHVYVSIYVNPTQFGVNEDLNTYPKTWDADMEKLNELCKEFGANPHVGQITTVFAPITLDMYPGLPPTSELYGEGSFVTITPLSSVLEGASRPVFFRGVATVVMKLLNLVQPETVYFGQKDIQQTLVINRMMQDFHLNTTLRIGPTVREVDGLAMSSRNVYLGKRRRAIATVLLSALHAVETAYAKGATQRQDLLAAALEITSSEQEKQRRLSPSRRAMFEVEYISIAEPSSLSEVTEVSPNDGAVLSGAIKMLPVEEPQAGEDTGLGGGKTMVRLIDNILLDRDKISSRTGINYSLEH